MLIPDYLKDIIITDYLDQYTGKFKIKCLCGCEKFFLCKNIKKQVKISKEDRKRIKETEICERVPSGRLRRRRYRRNNCNI